MAKTTNREKLQKLFPTLEGFMSAFNKHTSRDAFAKALGMSGTTLKDHLKWLTEGKYPKAGVVERDGPTMDKAIKAMARENGKENLVSVYRITGEYVPMQAGYEGLEFVRTMESRTWVEVGHMINKRSVNKNPICAW